LIVVILIGETGFRIYLKFIYQPPENPESEYIDLLPHSNRVYGLKPDSEILGLNSSGFRGRELVVDKAYNVFRIVMLGDSIIFGVGVDEDETLPHYLEQILQQREDRVSYEVYNLGIVGYNTRQELATLEEVGLQLQPDLVILNICLNDSDPVKEVWKAGLVKKASISSFKDINLRTIVGISYFLTFVKQKAIDVIRKYDPAILDKLNDPSLFLNQRVVESAWSDMKEDMLVIERLSVRNGARFMASIYPYKSQVALYKENLTPQNDITSFFQDHNIQVFDTIELYKDAEKEMFSDQALHLSAYGGKRVAAGLAEFLVDRKLLRSDMVRLGVW